MRVICAQEAGAAPLRLLAFNSSDAATILMRWNDPSRDAAPVPLWRSLTKHLLLGPDAVQRALRRVKVPRALPCLRVLPVLHLQCYVHPLRHPG